MDIKRFDKRVYLASPTIHEEEKMYVKEAFDTNWVSTLGKNIDELENGIKNVTGMKGAVATGSGTSALHLAMLLAGLKEGDTVIAQSLTFDATVNPVAYEKGKLVFVDSERETWNMDPKALEKALDKYPDCKLVITVNLYGVPCMLDEIKAICESHSVTLIEDAAESLGATYKGIMTGSFGKYNAISFNGNKIITTSGGGMLLTHDTESAAHARKLATQARDKAPWYQHSELGYNYRLSNISAGIGRGQLLHLNEHIARKTEIYERYKEAFKDMPVKMNPYLSYTKPIFWLSCMLIDENAMEEHYRGDLDYSYTNEHGKSCPEHIRETLEKYNVESRPIWKPMHMQPIYKDCDYIKVGEEDVSKDIFDRGICLPSDITMSNEEQDIIIEIVKSCFA